MPCLTYGMRGMIAASVEVKGPARDLHSGNDGGPPHPLRAASYLPGLNLPNILLEFYSDCWPGSACLLAQS